MSAHPPPSPEESVPAPARTPGREPPGRPSRCAQCQYDLTGTLAAGHEQCPECGHTLDDVHSRSTREHAFFRRFGWWLVLGTLVALGAVIALTSFLGERAALFSVPLVLLLFGWLPFVLVARLTRDME